MIEFDLHLTYKLCVKQYLLRKHLMFPSVALRNTLKNLKSTNAITPLLLKGAVRPSLLKSNASLKTTKSQIHPNYPARTRFAPSPTGVLHLGSLRTALYNFLLAKQTGGEFLVRLEDTDQSRLVPGAEENVYETLKWAGIKADESPEVGGPYGPYRQSDRAEIYKEYIDILLSKGLAYKCYCPKERLVKLRESAQKLKPPTTLTYDRKCFHGATDTDNNEYVVRFKAPDMFPITEDLQRGSLNIQPQYNEQDRRYDDFVIMKLDGLPTYHFANVVDDHLMKITHVIRGEEWLTSTPKHLALYQAFGWKPPKFVHVPLLTSLDEKKLSKRHGDNGVFSFRKRGVTPEALTNFVALFGWSPKRDQHGKKVKEVLSLSEMIEKFRLDDMTRGNTKVSDSKLWYFNRHHLPNSLRDSEKLNDIATMTFEQFSRDVDGKYDFEYYKTCLHAAAGHIDKPADLLVEHPYFFKDVSYKEVDTTGKQWMLPILETIKEKFDACNEVPAIDDIKASVPNEKTPRIMQSLRFALTGSVAGVEIASISSILGQDRYGRRLQEAIEYLRDESTKAE